MAGLTQDNSPAAIPSKHPIQSATDTYRGHITTIAVTPPTDGSSPSGRISQADRRHRSSTVKETRTRSDSSKSGPRKSSLESSTLVDPLTVPSIPTSTREVRDVHTPCTTPNTSRKLRRRSNLFPPLRKGEDEKKVKNGEVGSGRVIPIRQGYLYKRSSKTLNKEWRKKYVTLTNDGRLTYHPSLHDYMNDVHGKEIPLMHTTVKIPGQKPKGFRTCSVNTSSASSQNAGDLAAELSSLSIAAGVLNGCDIPLIPARIDSTSSVKKRHRRMKSVGLRNLEGMDDSDGNEFMIVSLDNKQWHFGASSNDDREAWVSAIEQQILSSLQSNESSKSKYRMTSLVDFASIQAIKTSIPGNSLCVDCNALNPDWASINIGALICIECSGIHRNLGSHITRVRSLDLDEWPPEHISVMMSVGNTLANSIWESNVRGNLKPSSDTSREEKERWIRRKYESKDFLASMSSSPSLTQQLADAIRGSDVKKVMLLLAHSSSNDDVNTTSNSQDLKTPLHLAASKGNLTICQLLLWHNANVDAVDSEGKNALAYARLSGSQEVQDLLIQNGCPATNAIPISGSKRRRGSLSKSPPEASDRLSASIS